LPPATILGAHPALLKMMESYVSLGLATTPCWANFWQLVHTSATTYLQETATRFTHLAEITPTQLASLTLDFVGQRVAIIYFNTLAQCQLAAIPANDARWHDLIAALRCFVVARQIGDDVGDWQTDLQVGQLNYVSARLISRFYEVNHSQAIDLERLVGYQIRDETLWREFERARLRQILGEAGLLTELGPGLTKLANKSTATLTEVVAELDHLSDKSLSDLVLEQRRAKLW